MIRSLRDKLSSVTNAKVHVIDYEQGQPLEAPIVVRLFGEDSDTLQKYAGEIEKIVSNTEGTMYLYNPLAISKTDIKVNVDKEKAALKGVQPVDIDHAVRLAVSGIKAGELKTKPGEDNISIQLRADRDRFQTIDIFEKIYVPSVFGQSIPLKDVARIEFQRTPGAIRKIDKELYTTINAFGQDGYLYSELNKKVFKKLKQLTLPDGYHIKMAGEVRFIPILLTTMTAVAAMIPLVIEFSPLYSPLALVLIGGLVSSLLLSRIVTPVLYKLLSPEIK